MKLNLQELHSQGVNPELKLKLVKSIKQMEKVVTAIEGNAKWEDITTNI